MKISHQINLFFEYKMADRLIIKLEKDLKTINDKNIKFFQKRKENNKKSKQKWLNRKEEILKEWKLYNDFSIDDFPYIKKSEIMKYYNNSKRIKDRNPFLVGGLNVTSINYIYMCNSYITIAFYLLILCIIKLV